MQTLKIDIVSDVACPWCPIGYQRLETAMQELDGELAFELEWRAFELNPGTTDEGGDILEALCRKYGRSAAEMQAAQAEIVAAAEALGLNFDGALERRVHNTFDAHRIIEWAGEQGRQTAFSLALFDVYFGQAKNPSDPEVLRSVAESLGLDGAAVDDILASERYVQSVRAEQDRYKEAGVSAVPTFVINDQYLISGAQDPQAFVKAFRKIAAETDAA